MNAMAMELVLIHTMIDNRPAMRCYVVLKKQVVVLIREKNHREKNLISITMARNCTVDDAKRASPTIPDSRPHTRKLPT